uniref:sensor histidine kinase n=1 Tax=Actinotalea sp. TaxID=1872145 RepID=UPI003562047B
LTILVVLTSAITVVNTTGTILLFIAYSQIWFFSLSRRGGVIASTALTIGVFGALAAAPGVDPSELPSVLAQAALALAFAVLLGLWITQVAEQSELRAVLIDRLEAAQAELAASHHAAGVTAERERLAQEIHDTLAQGFTSVIMLAQAARADLDRADTARAVERLALVEHTARENLAEARALVAAFAPVGLAESGLPQALARLASRFTQETGVAVEVEVDESCTSMGREREVILLRSAQEALTNVRRHAAAEHVRLSLARSSDGQVRLEVVDDGNGIDAASAEGFGLRGMRERVASGGGRLAVTGGPSGGTRVLVTLPEQGPAEEPVTDRIDATLPADGGQDEGRGDGR